MPECAVEGSALRTFDSVALRNGLAVELSSHRIPESRFIAFHNEKHKIQNASSSGYMRFYFWTLNGSLISWLLNEHENFRIRYRNRREICQTNRKINDSLTVLPLACSVSASSQSQRDESPFSAGRNIRATVKHESQELHQQPGRIDATEARRHSAAE